MSPRALLAAIACWLLAGCAGVGVRDAPPIVFIHGNGDSAAVWQTTLWRFETNGWPRDRLFALDAPLPLARTEDDKPQEGRTSAAEHMAQVAAEVERARTLAGAEKVILVANSRGATAVRNYVRNGGAGHVSHAVLGGGVYRGVWIDEAYLPTSEFNGASAFLKALNAPQGPGGEEVTPGVKFLTLRSDNLDKWTQPDGRWFARPGMKTNARHDGAALKGAQNTELPGRDHREASFNMDAFLHTHRFILGQLPGRADVVAEPAVVLDGRITGFHGNDPTNLPLSGAALEVFEVSPATGERLGVAAHAKTVGADGQWGPFHAQPGAAYEFVIRAEGFATTHIYRSPFPRSSNVVHMRPGRLAAADKGAGSVVTMSRPRGYLGVGRDRMSLDGAPPPGLAPGVPGASVSKLMSREFAPKTVVAEFNGERIAARAWPAQENHISIAEFHY